MKFWIIVCPWLAVQGMALYPFILIKNREQKTDVVLINHEKIHLRQQIELLLVFFYLLYFFNYLINLARYRNHHLAYLHIMFEKEAYRYEKNLEYLTKRKFCQWIFTGRK